LLYKLDTYSTRGVANLLFKSYQTENKVISINNNNHKEHTLLPSSVNWQLV